MTRWRRRLRAGSTRPAAPTLLRVYLLVGVTVLAVAFLLYFQSLTRRVDDQTELMSEMLARFVVVAASMVADRSDTTAAVMYQDVVRRANFPIILSDHRGMPMLWNESQVPVPLPPLGDLFEADPADPPPDVRRVLLLQESLDGHHDPIPLRNPADSTVFGYVHYGSPALSRELRWVPWVTIVTAALFGFTALAALRSIKRSELSFIWAGLAKESAHQMGTPISSLLGWVEVLREERAGASGKVEVDPELYAEAVTEIERDADRLNRVAARFSQIGSAPRLTVGGVEETVRQTVDYFQRRMPRQGSTVALSLEMTDDLPEVRRNTVLLGWVLENLIKNAVNAADKNEGRIHVTARRDGSAVRISVRDNGRGVKAGMEGQIFRPGVSTRDRGWGLGLALSRRIVGDYHGGRLELTWTEEGKGAEFTLTLPAAG
jgi:hypothetical protein